MKTKKLLTLLLAFILAFPFGGLVCAVSTSSAEIYVSTKGNDNNSGTRTSPLLTLDAAKEKAKTIKGCVSVIIREGTYYFDKTLCFDKTDKNNVTYKAYQNEKVIFTAGKPYTGFEECEVNGVRAFVTSVAQNDDFNIMFNDTTTLTRTRYPEKGYFFVKDVTDNDIINFPTDALFNSYNGMYVDKSDFKNFKNINDVIVRVLHYWKDELLTVNNYTDITGHVTFNRGTSMKIAPNDKYFLENVFEALNEPGEWYLDKTEHLLYYVPFDGENAEDLTLWASQTQTMIRVDGVNGISFKGITFRGNGFALPSSDLCDCTQAAYDATPCVSYENANGFTVTNCDFKDIASCALFFGKNVQNATADSCYFENLGAQAFYVRGDNLPVEDATVTKNINFTNNCINGYGKMLFNAVGVLVIHANTVNIENNEIHDGYYTAVSVGWIWGYGYTVTYNNRICNNLIYNIGQGWLSDMGGIYTLGNQPGTVISGNCIHNVAADVEQGGYGGWGIYLDEGSAYILVEKNLVYACGNDGFHLHYGSYNTVRNNIFALNGESQIRVVSNTQRCTPADGGKKVADFTGNILLTDNKVMTFSSLASKESYAEQNNIFWDLHYGADVYVGKSTDAAKAMGIVHAQKWGYITNPILVNPDFTDAQHFDFSFKDTKAVTDSGFEVWDLTVAGTKQDTVIGTSHPGGQTPYNAEAKTVKYTSAHEVFHELIAFFYKVIDLIIGLFNK